MKNIQISIFSPNAGKCGPEKTLYLGTFHAVEFVEYHDFSKIMNTFLLKRKRLKVTENVILTRLGKLLITQWRSRGKNICKCWLERRYMNCFLIFKSMVKINLRDYLWTAYDEWWCVDVSDKDTKRTWKRFQ